MDLISDYTQIIMLVLTMIILIASIIVLIKTRKILNPVKPSKSSDDIATQEGINTLKLIFLQIEGINKEVRLPDAEECEYIKKLIEEARANKVSANVLSPLIDKLNNICPKS